MFTFLDTLNAEKRNVVNTFNRIAPVYDTPALRYARLIAEKLVTLAQVQDGDLVLDACTGTGSAAIEAAKRVGAGGRVVGVDLANAMLERAQQKIVTAEMENVALRYDDIEHLDFDDNTFDVVLCASSIHFLPNILNGVRELARVTKRGGSVAFSSYGEPAFQPMSDLFEARLRNYGVPFPTARRPFAWQRLTDPECCRELLQAASMGNILVQVQQLGYFLVSSEEWWEIVSHSAFHAALASLTPEQLEKFRAEHLAEIETLCQLHGVWLNVPAIFAVGEK